MNLNLAPSPFDEQNDHHGQHHQPLIPNHHVASSSSPSFRIFFNSSQDHTGFHRDKMNHPQHQEVDLNYANHAGSYDPEKKVESGFKLSLWKKEDPCLDVPENSNNNPVKWMSSKMRLMQKMKNTDRVQVKITSNHTSKNEDQKQPSSSLETELSSNTSSSYNNCSPIRVCSDCNTTKTPLWRSGPKGPKSLCNACGIRQRKARRAMAAAAAAANGTALKPQAQTMKIKLQNKEKTAKNGQLKKRCKVSAEPSEGEKKIGFEDFLINLSNKLALHRMFPQDEKDAAILLMAISSGLVHG